MPREVTVRLGNRQLKMRVPDDATSAQIQSFAEQHLNASQQEPIGGSTAEDGLGSLSGQEPGAIEKAMAEVDPMAMAQYAPTALRAVGDVGGNLAALGLSEFPPAAIAAKLGIPLATDYGAQKIEESLGTRPEGYNWKRGLAETGAAQIGMPGPATGVAGLAREGVKGGLKAVGIGEFTGLAEGEQPTWTQRAVSFFTGAALTAAGSKAAYSQRLKQEAEDLVRFNSAEEYAKTGVPVHEAQYIGETPGGQPLPTAEASKATPNVPKVVVSQGEYAGETPIPPGQTYPEAEVTSVVPKHIQDDFDELNGKPSAPRETMPAVVSHDVVEREVDAAGPPRIPDPFGGRLQIEGPVRAPYKEGIRRTGGFAPMHEVVNKLEPTVQQGMLDDWRSLRAQDRKSVTYKDSKLRDRRDLMNEPVWGLTRIFKGTSPAKQEAYNAWLEAPDKDAFEIAHGFDAHDKLAVRHLRKNYNEMFQDFGINPDDWLENYAPHIRKMDDEQFAVFLNDPRNPAPVKFFAEHLRGTEGFDRFETNGLKNAAAYLNLGSFKKHMADSWELLHDKYSKLASSSNPAEAEAGQAMVDMLVHYRYRTPDKLGKMINVGLNNTINKLSGGKFKLTAGDILSTTQQLQTAALLSGRPMTAIRNATQIIDLAGARLGPKWLGRGIQAYNTPEGKLRALPYTGQGMHDIADLQSGLQTPVRQELTNLNKAGMKMFTTIEDWGRGVVYNAQRLKTIEAAAKARGAKSGKLGDVFQHTMKSGPDDVQRVNEFLSRSDVDMMPKAVRDLVTRKYLNDDIEGAADVAADYVIQETLFDYGPLGRPPALRKEFGRIVGSFGVWPANYVSFAKNLATQGPIDKRVRDVARFGALTAASVAAISKGSEFAFDTEDDRSILSKTSEQIFSPLGYTTGPVVPAMQAAGSAFRSVVSGRPLGYSSKQALKQGALSYVPGSKAYKNFSDAYEDPSGFRTKLGQLFEASSDQPISQQRKAAAAFRRGITRF